MIGKLNSEQIEEVLRENVLGHLGCNDGVNTYVYPFNYLYDGKYITCHSQQGFKMHVMRQNNRVCLQIDEVNNHKDWKSVMVLGEFEEVCDERDYADAMTAFADRRLFLKISESSISPRSYEPEMKMQLLKGDSKPSIFRIVISEKNGMFENEWGCREDKFGLGL